MSEYTAEQHRRAIEMEISRLNCAVREANRDGYAVNLGLSYGNANGLNYNCVEMGRVEVPFWKRATEPGDEQ